MKVTLLLNEKEWTTQLKNPLDISIPLNAEDPSLNCFYAPMYSVSPVKEGNFIGDTQKGGSVNFKNIFINPHGNGTHTECVGHISKEVYKLNDCLRTYHFTNQVISVHPTKLDNGDRIVFKEQIEGFLTPNIQSLTIRTLPNSPDKLHRNYSGINAPFLDAKLVKYIVQQSIEHLIIDLPSIDKEQDEGRLAAHKAFWQYPENIRKNSTITELVFVPDTIKDGLYLVNIQVGNYDIDASPSKVLLYPLKPKV